jgi:hypothetical protein
MFGVASRLSGVRRLPAALVAALLLLPASAAGAAAPTSLRELDRVPADPSLPLAHPVDLSQVQAPDRLPDLGAKPRIPGFLKFSERGDAHAADHWTGTPVKEEQYQDTHGHVLTLATDNAGVDLAPFANLLASTYHYGEIEFVHAFVTSGDNLREICGGEAAACYGADDPQRLPSGVMVVSYEDSDVTHGVIHEYGHHVDNNTYNLGGLSDCGIDGDGSRRWFFAREMEDRILDNLSCDPRPGWGQLLPEVFAEDYSQMVGIPRAEYHPAIRLDPPTARQKRRLKRDLDAPFEPVARQVSGRASRSGKATFRFRSAIPVFVAARSAKGVRSVRVRGCNFERFTDVFAGSCRVAIRAKPGGRYSFRLVVY